MKSFKQFNSIVEGGNAVSGVVKINQENVAATMHEIYTKILPKLGLREEDSALLGSTGKKNPGGQSGDIDLAINGSKMIEAGKAKDPKDLVKVIGAVMRNVSPSVKEMPGLGIVSIAYPIVNADTKQPDQFVQLDFMLSPDLEWSKWVYWSPAEWESSFKGLYRNAFLSAISHVAGREGNDITWRRKLFHFGTGLHEVNFSKKGKNGKLLKNGKELSRKFLARDPQGVIDILLGPKFKASNILTVEDMWKAINSKDFLWKSHNKEIIKRFKEDVINKGYPVPDFIK